DTNSFATRRGSTRRCSTRWCFWPRDRSSLRASPAVGTPYSSSSATWTTVVKEGCAAWDSGPTRPRACRSCTRATSCEAARDVADDASGTPDDGLLALRGLAVRRGTAAAVFMARRIKILSDFDGVWTNQRFEAADLLRHLVEQLAALTGQGVASVRNDVDRFTDAMRSAPHEHGWAPDGRISAYVDEDPLCESSALCRFLELSDLPRAQAYRRAVL